MERGERDSYQLKTSSIWGYPPRRFFRFLKIIQVEGLPKTLIILGCSDGRYVIPAAKRGFEVLAVDIDQTALMGGTATIAGKSMKMEGLVSRVEQEGVADLVTVVEGDFFTYHPRKTYSGLFTSGSIHYRENSKYSLGYITDKIQAVISDRGLLLFEYITPSNNRDSSRHYVSGKQLADYFRDPEWKITSNKRKTYIEPSNPRSDHIHKITWGRLYAQRWDPNFSK